MVHPLKGRKQSSEHIAKRVAAMHASGAYVAVGIKLAALNKGKPGPKRTPEQRARHSVRMKGVNAGKLVGFKRSEEFRRKLSEYWLANPEKHNHYVDGRGAANNDERVAARQRIEYRLWREAVFERDNWTCVKCDTRGGELHADHIRSWRNFPELRYAIDNGRTMCPDCHRKTPTYGKSGKRLAEVEGLSN